MYLLLLRQMIMNDLDFFIVTVVAVFCLILDLPSANPSALCPPQTQAICLIGP
jgi:hypothetical protein